MERLDRCSTGTFRAASERFDSWLIDYGAGTASNLISRLYNRGPVADQEQFQINFRATSEQNRFVNQKRLQFTVLSTGSGGQRCQ